MKPPATIFVLNQVSMFLRSLTIGCLVHLCQFRKFDFFEFFIARTPDLLTPENLGLDILPPTCREVGGVQYAPVYE